MAKLDLILQALTARFHAGELQKILSQEGCTRVLASVAFVLKDGVDSIAPQLKNVAKVSTFYIGIRNDITSIQGVTRLLELGVRVIAVDTGSRHRIFHPKLFLAERKFDAKLVIGSANLTFSGLHNNIEAGAILDLDLTTKDDKDSLKDLIKTLEELATRFPSHVFQIKNIAEAEALFEQGRLLDEDVVIASVVTTSLRKGKRDLLKPIELPRHTAPYRKRIGVRPKSKTTPAAATLASAIPADGFVLIWESRGLTERDLNIPSGKQTNRTGSMLWKKGAVKDINPRHFFREEVFAALDWQVDLKLSHYERTKAKFQILIKGVNFGVFELKLSHNTKTNTATYSDNNLVTQVHWGSVRELVAKPDLLGRVMSLYRKDGNPPQFLIEID